MIRGSDIMNKKTIKEALKETYNKGVEIGTEFNEDYQRRKSMIAERLTTLRKQTGLTQEELAKEINVNRATYAGYEKERTEPNCEVLARLATFHNVSLDYIFGVTDNPYGKYSDYEKSAKADEEISKLKEQMDNQMKELKENIMKIIN